MTFQSDGDSTPSINIQYTCNILGTMRVLSWPEMVWCTTCNEPVYYKAFPDVFKLDEHLGKQFDVDVMGLP